MSATDQNPREKRLPLAIGLNVLLPGLGYMYMGKWIVGLLACLLVAGILATAGMLVLIPTWLVLNLIMAIDIMILSGRRQKAIVAATSMSCPRCAELIKREANLCRFCGADLTVSSDATSIDSVVAQAGKPLPSQEMSQARATLVEPRSSDASTDPAVRHDAGDTSPGTSDDESMPGIAQATEPRWHLSRGLVAFAIALAGLSLIVGGGIWLTNYQYAGYPLARVLSGDPRNAGIAATAHIRGYTNPSVLVFDLQSVSGTNSAVDVFRVLLQFAAAMKQHRFTRVELAHRGQTRFFIAGDYFAQLGNEYSEQNPVYTIRTFPEHLFMPDGSPAYGTWSGGLLGVLSKQMEDFNDFHRKWYLNEIVTSLNASAEAPAAETRVVADSDTGSTSKTEAHGEVVEASVAPPNAPTETTQAPLTESTEPLHSVGIDPPFEPTPKPDVTPAAKPARVFVVSQVYIADGLYYRVDCEHPARAIRTPKAMAIQQGFRPAPGCYQPKQTTTGQP